LSSLQEKTKEEKEEDEKLTLSDVQFHSSDVSSCETGLYQEQFWHNAANTEEANHKNEYSNSTQQKCILLPLYIKTGTVSTQFIVNNPSLRNESMSHHSQPRFHLHR